jgi:sarcosine oxidase, subunit beta
MLSGRILSETGMTSRDNIVIIGAGIAGISTAYFLAVRHGLPDVILVDPLPPLSLTSDKSTECYRSWWPDSSMIALMNRSIDLMEELAGESGNRFQLSRRGYLYVTGDSDRLPGMRSAARRVSELGGGPLRDHTGLTDSPAYQPSHSEGYLGAPLGADLISDPALLERHFPYLTSSAAAALHVRRAGWFSGQQLGVYLLEQARAHGARLIEDRVIGVEVHQGRVRTVQLESGDRLEAHILVNAAGPLIASVAEMMGIELPVFNELHLKASFNDSRGVIPRSAPMLIWSDPQKLVWTPDEQAELAQDPELRGLLNELPAGAHTRPEGGEHASTLLMLWEYGNRVQDPAFPIQLDPIFPEIVLRGLSTMLPGLQVYFNHMGRPWLDGGYYTQTRENLPLIGPLPVDGAYLIGALAGFGLMAACAAGELLALHITRRQLPPYAPSFDLARYQNPDYVAQLEAAETIKDQPGETETRFGAL